MYYVYKFLDKNGICIYVGKTKSLKNRINSHKRAKWYKSDLDIYYLEFEHKETMDFIELYCINKFKPIQNYQNRNIIELEKLNVEPLNFIKFNLEVFLNPKIEFQYNIHDGTLEYITKCDYVKSFLDYDTCKYVLIFTDKDYNDNELCILGRIVKVWIQNEYEFDLSSNTLLNLIRDEDYYLLEIQIDLNLLKELIELKDIVYLNGIEEVFRHLNDFFKNINNDLEFEKLLNISKCI